MITWKMLEYAGVDTKHVVSDGSNRYERVCHDEDGGKYAIQLGLPDADPEEEGPLRWDPLRWVLFDGVTGRHFTYEVWREDLAVAHFALLLKRYPCPCPSLETS